MKPSVHIQPQTYLPSWNRQPYGAIPVSNHTEPRYNIRNSAATNQPVKGGLEKPISLKACMPGCIDQQPVISPNAREVPTCINLSGWNALLPTISRHDLPCEGSYLEVCTQCLGIRHVSLGWTPMVSSQNLLTCSISFQFRMQI